MIRNNLYWVWYIKESVLTTLDFYRRSIFEKIIPSFSSIETEAHEIEEQAYDRIMSLPSDGYGPDPSDLAESAFDEGLEYYEFMHDMLQGIMNLFAVGLHHLLEQQLIFVLRKELLTLREENALSTMTGARLKRILSFEEAKKRLRTHGIEIEQFGCWSKISELRLVANAIKHAEGDACERLKLRRPELFIHPMVFRSSDVPVGPVFSPLSGEDIYVTKEKIGEYINSVREFWKELIEALKLQGPVDVP